MTHSFFVMLIAIVLFAGATPGWSQQYLYVPRPLAAEEKVQKKDGVLVQEVAVKKGDTLFGISRRFSGRGSYYPQILLFNDLKDPNLIYPGNVLKIPVSRRVAPDQAVNPQLQSQGTGVPSAGPVVETPAEQNNRAAAEEKKPNPMLKSVAPARKDSKGAKQTAVADAASAEQRLYERAIKAYRQDDYRTAVELFDRFLVDYPSSALAADASLYKAECYLKQSNQ
jgi:LysM repeat protein